MKAFRYERPGSTAAATKASSRKDAVLKSGGIDLLDQCHAEKRVPQKRINAVRLLQTFQRGNNLRREIGRTRRDNAGNLDVGRVA